VSFEIAAIALVIGLALGLLLAAGRLSWCCSPSAFQRRFGRSTVEEEASA
jgi:hypothetical protein